MSRPAHQDATVIRTDPSLSVSFAGEGVGETNAPRILKQRFVLEEKLGSGGMGTVFRAKDLRKVEARDRQPYLAIKVLNDNFRAHPEAFIALQREAAKSQAVSHANIVSIYDYDKDGDVPFITMELLEGQELADLLRAYPNGLPDPMAWEVIRGICAGLGHAHSTGVVHADFKPGNVFVSPRNAAKVLDFGIARAVRLNQIYGEETVIDPVRLGALTPAYASREMLQGDNPEPRDDIYALGVVIYLILTGHHPYGRTPADEAAREGLAPDRPRRLTRRQWRVLEKCLRFNRHERPATIDEVEHYLLKPAPWRSRTALAAAAAFALSLGINYLVGDAELTEVREEVRQSTLVDAQTARVQAMLSEPDFEPGWEDRIASELDRLNVLDESGASGARMSAQIIALLTQRIVATRDLGNAFELYRSATRFGEPERAGRVLHDRLLARVFALLESPQPEQRWFDSVRRELARLASTFPESKEIEPIRLEVGDAVEAQLLRSIDRGDFPAAKAALAELEPLRFDVAAVERLARAVEDAEFGYAAAEQLRAVEENAERFEAAIADVLDTSCLRLDLGPVAALFDAWVAEDAGLGSPGRQMIGAKVAGCVAQLGEHDLARAAALADSARTRFGELPQLAEVRLDPCSARYLVGAGAQAGRSGYCADRLVGDLVGPRLVVVPNGEARFAITRHEISRGQLNAYCAYSGACGVADADQLPATGVDVVVAQGYARWLSEITGFTYRLPTLTEWRLAAQGAPDASRNCRVEVDGVERGLALVPASSGQAGEFGLINALGNAQEWVLDGGKLRVAGGAFDDAIGDCVPTTVRDHQGRADAVTGFRLVREIS